MVEIAPANASAPGEERYVYVIQASHALPEIDCFRALKHVLLRGKRLKRCNRFLSKHKRWLGRCLVIGFLQALLVPYLPANVGRFAAFIGLVELPAVIAVIAVSVSLRYDMIRLLLRTYEFWYLSILNLVFVLVCLFSYNDARAILMLPSALSFELLPLQDANFRALRFTILVFCLAAATHVALVVFINLHQIDQWNTVQVIRYGKHAFVSDNVVSNYLVITTAVLLRNAYRKHRWVRDCNGGETAIVRCISYRCRVNLCLQDSAQLIHKQSSTDDHRTQMRLVPSDQVYDSDKTVARCFLHAARVRIFFLSHRRCLWLTHAIGATGLVLTCVTLIIIDSESLQRRPCSMAILSATGAITTASFCGLIASMYQCQLLQRLLTSFDFMLWVANITILHLSVADAFAWTSQCVSVLSSWVWIMWVITMDALMPEMRQALGLRRRHLVGVILIFVLLLGLLAVELIFVHRWHLQDRSLFQVITVRKTVHVHVLQFFFSCMFSLLPMCGRILWRLYHAKHGELLLIQGMVEYEDALLARRRQNRTTDATRTLTSSSISSRLFSWLNQPTQVQPASSGTDWFQGGPR